MLAALAAREEDPDIPGRDLGGELFLRAEQPGGDEPVHHRQGQATRPSSRVAAMAASSASAVPRSNQP